MSETKIKLLNILEILRDTDDTHPITAPQIGERLRQIGIEAERKSICRDINTLIEFGYDINLCTDNKLGYYFGKREFEDWELKVLIDAIWQAKFLTEACSESLAKRIRNLACCDSRKMLDSITPVKSDTKHSNLCVKINIDKLLTAIRKKRKVIFRYTFTDENLKTQYRKNGEFYVINPYSLVWLDDRYYLICNNDKYDELSYYRLDRIRDMEITDLPIKPVQEIVGPNPDIKMNEYVANSIYRFTGDNVLLTLHTTLEMIDELKDYFGEDMNVKKVGDKVGISVRIMESEGLYYWLLQHGESIEVVSPEKVRREYINRVTKILDKY